MSLTYTTFQNSVLNLMPDVASNPRFSTDLPNIIDYAELRCYRDLDLLNTKKTATATLTAGNRNLGLDGTFVVTEEINVITPATATSADSASATRNYLVPTSKEVLNVIWPSSTGSSVPVYFAMLSQSAVLLGPWPDQAYTVEVVGTFRPTPLSANNATTLLSTFFPDLFLAAAMVRTAGLMKDYGAQSDDPKLAQSWENQYTLLLRSAEVEEKRKKFQAEGWSSAQPSQIATPPRT